MLEKFIEKLKKGIKECPATFTIMGINLLLFIVINVNPNLAEQLSLNPDISMALQKPWTFVTVFFSHEVHVHLLGNMGLFFFFSLELEKITSSKIVYLVYSIGGFMGSLAIFPVATLIAFEELAIGASAAVFAIVTTYAVMEPDVVLLKSKAKWWAIMLFIFNGVIAFLNPQMSVGAGAHAVGSVIGLIYGLWLKQRIGNIKQISK